MLLPTHPRVSARLRDVLPPTHPRVSARLGEAPRFQVRRARWIDPVGGVSTIPIDLTADASIFTD